MFKLAVLLTIVLCAFVAQGANYEDDQNLGNDVDDLLRKLREKVDAAVAKAQAALDNAKARINKIADQIQGAARKEMQSSVDSIRAEIDKLKLKAKNAGVNIDECLAGNEDQLLKLPDKFSGDMVHCVSDRINEGIGYAQDGLNQIKKIVDEVENIKKEIKDCGHGWKAAKCLARLALKIERDITTLPAKIEADIAATVALITKLEEKIKKCASDKTGQCESEGKAILQKISVCVAKKLIIH